MICAARAKYFSFFLSTGNEQSTSEVTIPGVPRDIELPRAHLSPIVEVPGETNNLAGRRTPPFASRPRWFFKPGRHPPRTAGLLPLGTEEAAASSSMRSLLLCAVGRAEPDSVVLTLTHRVKACHFIAGVKSKIGAALKEMYDEYKGLVADTPMRRLRKLNTRHDVTVWAKLEGTNLGGSVKDRAALAMITGSRTGRTSQEWPPISRSHER